MTQTPELYQPDQQVASQQNWRRLAALVAVSSALVAALILVLAQSIRPHTPLPIEIDLLDQGSTYGASFTSPAEGDLGSYVHEKTFLIANEGRKTLFMHPPASASYRIQVPDQALLRFSMAIDPAAWDKSGDGVDFQVRLSAWNPEAKGNTESIVFSRYVNPRADPSARGWLDGSVDLAGYSGQQVQIIFQTFSHESAENDWAGWSRLRIVRR